MMNNFQLHQQPQPQSYQNTNGTTASPPSSTTSPMTQQATTTPFTSVLLGGTGNLLSSTPPPPVATQQAPPQTSVLLQPTPSSLFEVPSAQQQQVLLAQNQPSFMQLAPQQPQPHQQQPQQQQQFYMDPSVLFPLFSQNLLHMAPTQFTAFTPLATNQVQTTTTSQSSFLLRGTSPQHQQQQQQQPLMAMNHHVQPQQQQQEVPSPSSVQQQQQQPKPQVSHPPVVQQQSMQSTTTVPQQQQPQVAANTTEGVQAPTPTPTPKQEKVKAPPKPKKVPFETRLNELKDSRGAIDKIESVAPFVKLMEEEKTMKNRPIMLAVINVSNKPIQEKMIELGAVLTMREWLKDCSEKNKPKVMIHIMNVLSKMPLSLENLKSTEIGKVVKGLLKTHATNEQVKTRIESLMKQWRKQAEKFKQDQQVPSIPIPKKVKSDAAAPTDGSSSGSSSGGGIFSMLSNTTVPRKITPASAIMPKVPLLAAGNKPGLEAERKMTRVIDNSKTSRSTSLSGSSASGGGSGRPQHGSSSLPPVKRKSSNDDLDQQQTAAKRARTSSPTAMQEQPPAVDASGKKRVRWSENLELVKTFDKERPADGSELDPAELLLEQQQQQQQQQLHLQQQQQQQQRHGHSQASSYSQERAHEKQIFEQQREERRRKLEAMVARTNWIVPLPLANSIVHRRGQDSKEATERRNEHAKRPAVTYRDLHEIPLTPSSPVPTLNSALLKNLVSVLSAINPAPPVSSTTTTHTINSFAPPTMSSTTNHYQQQQQQHHHHNIAPQQHPYGGGSNSGGGGIGAGYAPPVQQHGYGMQQQQQQPFYEQPLLRPGSQPSLATPPMMSSGVVIKPSKAIRCRFFETSAGCRNGKSCPYYHEGEDPVPPGGVKEFDPEIARQSRQAKQQMQQQHRGVGVGGIGAIGGASSNNGNNNGRSSHSNPLSSQPYSSSSNNPYGSSSSQQNNYGRYR